MILPESLFALATALPISFTLGAIGLLAALLAAVTVVTVRLLRADKTGKPEPRTPQSDK